jgi:hypothetical protein
VERASLARPRICVNIRKLIFVPEGPNDRSQAIYCLEQVQSKIRPVGHGLILTHNWLVVLIVARLSDPITPSLRDGSLFERDPRQ